jgi:predicted AlkP superfamily phosphohydrolase/phosphomutase
MGNQQGGGNFVGDNVNNSQNKVLVIGLDGATFDYLLPRVKMGQLPNVARLLEMGNRGTLLSTIPFFTMPAWSSFVTGKNPANHGIISFFQRDPTSYDFEEIGNFVNASQIRETTLWQLLSASGKRVGIINVPMTYPSSEVNGFMISGMLTPAKTSSYTFPKHLAGNLGDYVIDLEYLRTGDHFDLSRVPDREALLADVTYMLQKRGETSLRLMAEYQWDFFMTVFTSTDRLCHFFWDYLALERVRAGEPELQAGIDEYFRLLDRILGDMMASAGESATVLIISDHGFGPAPTRRVNINNWLMDQGLLSINTSAESGMILSSLNLRLRGNQKLKGLLKKIQPQDIQRTIREGDRGKSARFIDWSKTRAYGYPLYANVCGIGVNQMGAKREGIVSPGPEYERLRDRLIDETRKMMDPSSGQPIVRSACRREELYDGKFIERFPDVILVMDSDCFVSTSMMYSDLVMSIPQGPYIGDHRQEGVLIISGPRILGGQLEQDAKIEDIAPTILYLLGIEVPDDMDGRVLSEVFDESYFQAVPPKYTSAQTESDLTESSDEEIYSEEEAEEIRERLRSLGYLG